MKGLRPLSFLLSIVLIFSVFTVSSSAAGDDFDSDLTNWVELNPLYTDIRLRPEILSKDVYDVIWYPMPVNDSGGLRYGAFYDAANLVAGNSYTFKFTLLTPGNVSALGGPTLVVSDYYRPFTELGGTLFIGLGRHSGDDFHFYADEDNSDDYCFVIDGTNYQDYFGYTCTLTFTMPNISNAGFGIFYLDGLDTSTFTNAHFYMCDFSLVCNTTQSLDSINSSIDNL